MYRFSSKSIATRRKNSVAVRVYVAGRSVVCRFVNKHSNGDLLFETENEQIQEGLENDDLFLNGEIEEV